MALRLTGSIDLAAFKWALGEIVSRHDALRSTFGFSGGNAWLRVRPRIYFPFETLDVAEVAPGGAGDVSVDALLQDAAEFAEQAFDLRRGPLLRARLVRLADREALLQIVIHHIVSDGWSVGVLLHELGVLYAGRVEGRGARLEPLPAQYVDYAIWQRELLTGDRLDRLMDYWRRALEGAPHVLELPADKPRPVIQSYRGTTVSLLLPALTTARLRALARQEDSTLFMVLLAVTGCLLSRWSGQSDLLIATTVANRAKPDFEALIGFFTNTLVMRIDTAGEPDFRAALRRVRDVVLAGLDHQDAPFDQVVNSLGPQRDLSRQPLAQVLFTMQNFGGELPKFPGIDAARLTVPQRTLHYDLVVSVDDEADAVRLSLTCSSDLFTEQSAERLLNQFGTLAEAAALKPDTPVGLLPILAADERRLVVAQWNATAAPYPAGRCLHELVEEQAKRSPDAVAVASHDGSLTYAGLDDQASVLARHLWRLGAGPEQVVAICLPRSARLAVAMLAVLKSGAACLTLDPGYPIRRIEFMLADSRAAALISESALAGRLPADAPPALLVDSPVPETESGAPEPRGSAVTDENLAYVIYTSGSTGRPKAVAVTHRGVCNLVAWMIGAHGWAAGQALAHLVALGFDAAVRDLFVPLASGAKVLLPAVGDAADPGRMRDLLQAQGVTTIHGVPSLVQALFGTDADLPAGIRRICCGGEALPSGLLEQCLRRGIELVNLYGPAEATIDACSFSCASSDLAATTVPIGRPISNVQVYVLDRELQPVPVGVPGEIFIGGMGVARGYLGRPGRTAQQFAPDPFAAAPGARMYRTGDMARWLSDGTLAFLGRLDRQVKIRGFRVEPGEVEAALARHDRVRECAVIAQESPGQAGAGARLVAYLVCAGAAPSHAELRSFLSALLPDYLIPAAFVPLAALPLAPNGKVDPAALPAPAALRPEVGAAYAAPQTPTGEVLAAIWTEILGVDRVGIHDDFFELGGHSLLAMRMTMRVSSVYNCQLPPTLPFTRRTISEIEQILRERSTDLELEQIAAGYPRSQPEVN